MTEHTMVPGNDRDQDVAVHHVDDQTATPGGHSRRIFLAGAGAGALGAAAVAATVTAVPAAAQTAAVVEADGSTSSQAVVAYVSDGSRGEITLFRGGHEVVVQDRTLARTLASRFDQALARTSNQER